MLPHGAECSSAMVRRCNYSYKLLTTTILVPKYANQVAAVGLSPLEYYSSSLDYLLQGPAICRALLIRCGVGVSA